jgi:phosphoribosylanthranilate isomerase
MTRTGPVRFKICCIQSIEEARLAIHYGASAVGLVSRMPSGPGPIDDETIAAIAEQIPPGVSTFLLTCGQSVDLIVEQQRRAGVNTIQLCDALQAGDHVELRGRLPGVAIVQVIHVTGEASVDEALRVSRHVNGLLLDSGNPALAVKELGGTGRVHDWSLSRKIVELVPVPVFLAGGLKPGNVGEAIRSVHPFGVDVCTGVRTDGALDEARLAAFAAEVASTGVRPQS